MGTEAGTQVRATVDIDRPPEAVWDWIEDPEKQKQWMKGVLSNEPTSEGPVGVGSTFRMRIREGRRVGEYDGTLTAYDKPRHMAVTLRGGCMKDTAMHVSYTLTPTARGTHVDYACGVEIRGFWRVLGFLFRIFGAMQVRSFFRTLKARAEAEPAAAGAPR